MCNSDSALIGTRNCLPLTAILVCEVGYVQLAFFDAAKYNVIRVTL